MFWFVLRNFGILYSFKAGSKLTNSSSSVRSYKIRIVVASTKSTTPSPSAVICVRESLTNWRSIPVPTIGASLLNKGTAWRIMFDPINARLASSCSRNGISEAAIDAICWGETSIKSTSDGSTTGKSASWRDLTLLRTNVPSSFNGALPCAIIFSSSSSAVR